MRSSLGRGRAAERFRHDPRQTACALRQVPGDADHLIDSGRAKVSVQINAGQGFHMPYNTTFDVMVNIAPGR